MAACRRAAKPIASLSVITLKNKINTQPLLDKNLFFKNAAVKTTIMQHG